ncbi:MAG: hypothetical protein H0V30_01890 [Chitinophagaceae bacterium]|nr:hypothetical protein [Chitinophagaceae bacterium]
MNSIVYAEECDATGAETSSEAGYIKKTASAGRKDKEQYALRCFLRNIG